MLNSGLIRVGKRQHRETFGREKVVVPNTTYLRWVDDSSVIGPDLLQGVLDVIGVYAPAAVLNKDGSESKLLGMEGSSSWAKPTTKQISIGIGSQQAWQLGLNFPNELTKWRFTKKV